MGRKKIAIIGGGISGLTAGVYGLIAGFDVEIYEKNLVVGGECTGWDRKGYHIDNCIHWMMGTTGGTELNRIWQTIGAVAKDVEIIRMDRMYTSEREGEQLVLWADVDRTEKEWIALSSEDEVEIRQLMKSVRMAMKVQIPATKPPELMNPIDLMKMVIQSKGALQLFRIYQDMDTQDLMNRFKHPLIQCIISDFCTKESMAQSFPMAYGNFVAGDGGIPRGGSREMALRIQRKFEKMGGKVFTLANVDEFLIDKERQLATGACLHKGELVQADYYICAGDTSYTFEHLLGKAYMDEIFQEMYEKRDAYPVYGMFQVAYAVNCAENAFQGELILDAQAVQTEPWMSDRMTIKTYAYEPSFAPEGKQVLQVLYGLDESAYEVWKEWYTDKDLYRAKKESLAKKLQEKIEERLPVYRGKLEILDIWTPMTYHRYCHAYKGYNQSFMPTKKSRKNPYPSATIVGVDNVVLAGQWLSPPGGLPGAAIQGKYAIQRILKKEGRKVKL